jgi:capsular polysaccharide transport system permease protein
MQSTRTPLAVTLSVWKALFLRESLARLFSARAAWLWLLAEPVSHVAFLVFFFSVIRVRTVGGVDTGVWLMVGLLAFFMFRRTGTQVMNGINANQALFVYRQVKPVDTALVRGLLEGFLMLTITVVVLSGSSLLGYDVIPADPLTALQAMFGLWLFGLAFGLLASVAVELVPEVGRIIGMVMTPLYFASGIMFPLSSVPPPYRDWLMFNPVAHGLEAVRLGFVPHYHAAAGLSLDYLYGCALVGLFLGLALHRRFALRLATQ